MGIAIRYDDSAELGDDQIVDRDLTALLGQLRDLSVKLSTALTPQSFDAADGEVVYSLVTDILRYRRLRDKVLGSELFGEPAWDILLELFAAEASGKKLSVSGACYASGVPSSTALRWIVRLEKEGLIERVDDPLDGRRSWLELTERAERSIHEFVSQMAIGFGRAAQLPRC